ncbi:spermidine synthase [Piscinibacter sp. XHJ-5]|uniref:spermidine synthase n=1 Tax=Piscinibacter sp. XHJ-5 TaxID=3037797 RepID=UPI002453603C|nr:spermidine synthase [Piscinibacter sp. XHJ-5]
MKKPVRLAPATMSEADGVRYLHLGTPWVQGAMRMRQPNELELEYIQRMMAWMLLRPQESLSRGHAVQLGLGAGTITRFCHNVMRMRTTAVELNPTVIAACRLWFKLPDDGARLTVLQADAANYAADPAHAQSADVLCVDLYDHDAASPVLDSAAFYRDCLQLLADGGVMSVNLFGRDASFERSTRRIAAAFGAERVRTLRPTKEGNTIVLALKGDDIAQRDTLAARAQNIETRFRLPAGKWLKMMRPLPAPAPAS